MPIVLSIDTPLLVRSSSDSVLPPPQEKTPSPPPDDELNKPPERVSTSWLYDDDGQQNTQTN